MFPIRTVFYWAVPQLMIGCTLLRCASNNWFTIHNAHHLGGHQCTAPISSYAVGIPGPRLTQRQVWESRRNMDWMDLSLLFPVAFHGMIITNSAHYQ